MSEPQSQEVDLGQELRELGEQLKKAIHVAREHPQTKKFQRQISQAVNDLSTHIDHALNRARVDEYVKSAGAQVREAAQSFKESAPEDIERGLAKGVRALNEKIRRAVEEAEKSSKEE